MSLKLFILLCLLFINIFNKLTVLKLVSILCKKGLALLKLSYFGKINLKKNIDIKNIIKLLYFFLVLISDIESSHIPTNPNDISLFKINLTNVNESTNQASVAMVGGTVQQFTIASQTVPTDLIHHPNGITIVNIKTNVIMI